MKPIRVLITDDHPVVLSGLQNLLQGQGDFEVVGEATSGKEAVELTAQLCPDVVLMDLHMAGLDGAEAIAQLRAQRLQTPVLVLTAYEGNADILRAIEAGATGYLLKDVQHEELFAAIRSIAQGKAILAPAIVARLLQLHQAHQPAREELSSRELEILTLVARGASNKEIAHNLYLSEATVKSHLLHLFRKLDVSDRTAAVTVALEQGVLRLEEIHRASDHEG